MQRFFYITLVFISQMIVACEDDNKGCTDVNALNYDSTATESDGSCEYPSNTKKTLLVLFNNTSNSNCGSFGIPLYLNALATHSATVIPLIAHPTVTDTLFSGAAVNLADQYNQSGYPDIGAGIQYNLLTLININNAIDESASITPNANANAEMKIEGDSVIIRLYAKVFIKDNNEYYACALLLEDNINISQSGLNDPAFRFNDVLRASTSTSVFGDFINSESSGKEMSFKKRYGIKIKPEWNISQLKLITLTWMRNGSDFIFINAGN